MQLNHFIRPWVSIGMGLLLGGLAQAAEIPLAQPDPEAASQPLAGDVAPPLSTASIPLAAERVVVRPVPAVGGRFGPAVVADLRQRLVHESEPQRLRAGNTPLHSPMPVQRFYRLRGYQPAWIDGSGKARARAGELLTAIAQAEKEGLRAAFYHTEAIVEDVRTLRIAFLPTARQLANFDLLLTDAFLTYAKHLLSGRVDPKRIDHEWLLQPRSRDLTLALENALKRGAVQAALNDLTPPHEGYRLLRKLLADYRELYRSGGWPEIRPGDKLALGARGPRVAELAARLHASGDLPLAGETAYFDERLAQAVRHFQRRHGLKDDGVVGPSTLAELNASVGQRIRDIEANMERWRWLPEQMGERRIEVNIPDYEMRLIENDHETLRARAVVGRADRPTPIMSASMSHIIMSPYWYVPPTIVKEDKLPLLRKNPQALKKQGIRVFAGGREINPSSVDWHQVSAKNFSYTLRQDPGRGNVLGGMKFMFPNRNSIYIHDTPSRHLFERDKRSYSSGCGRIDSPLELAEQLLRDNSDWTRNKILGASKKRRERRVDLSQEIPVHLLYWTAWVEPDGSVQFREDIYGVDAATAKRLYAL